MGAALGHLHGLNGGLTEWRNHGALEIKQSTKERRLDMNRLKWFAVLILLTTSSMAKKQKEVSYQAYDGPARPLDQVAVVNFDITSKHPLRVLTVDNQGLQKSWDRQSLSEGCKTKYVKEPHGRPPSPVVVCKDHPNSIQLLPGPHKFIIYAHAIGWEGRICNGLNCAFVPTITVAAGKRYYARAILTVLNSTTTFRGNSMTVATLGAWSLVVDEMPPK